MTLKALTIVVLRIWAITTLIMALLTVVGIVSNGFFGTETSAALFVSPVTMLIFSGLVWLVARYIAALLTRGIDGPLPFTALTREDVYCCAFVILGLNFALASVASALLELYQYTQVYAYGGYPTNGWGQYTVPLLKHILSLIAGLACILGAKAWTRKLLRYEEKRES